MLNSDILKVGHHGSHSTLSATLRAISPSLAVITTGDPGLGNTARYHFPEHDAIKRISQHFEDRFKKEDLETEASITACIPTEGGCIWKSLPKHKRLKSTALSGSITVYATPDSACVF